MVTKQLKYILKYVLNTYILQINYTETQNKYSCSSHKYLTWVEIEPLVQQSDSLTTRPRGQSICPALSSLSLSFDTHKLTCIILSNYGMWRSDVAPCKFSKGSTNNEGKSLKKKVSSVAKIVQFNVHGKRFNMRISFWYTLYFEAIYIVFSLILRVSMTLLCITNTSLSSFQN